MKFVVITNDKTGAIQIRLDTRADHLAYIEKTGIVEMAGPFVDEDGQMYGSMIVLSADTLDAAQSWADNDPYAKAGLFADVQIREWKKVVG